MNSKTLTITMNLDQELAPAEQTSQRILELVLQTPEATPGDQRLPLNLALVLDHSGSMAGDKLDYVKRAARHVVSLLQENDRAALVVFDQHVNILFHSLLLDAETRPALISAIESIHTGGNTNLGGGWLTGCQEVAARVSSSTINHSLLLTDGLANEGITDPAELAQHARELSQRGVTTSTFGVGVDFNHHLLEDMANQGGGRFYFIESPDSIQHLFETEFKQLLTVFAHELEVSLSYPQELQVSVLGDWHSETIEPGKLRIFLGSISAGKKQELYLKAALPAMPAGTILPLKVSVRAQGENSELIETCCEQSLRLAELAEVQAAPRNETLLNRFAKVELADRAAAALKLEVEGHFGEASDLLKNILASQPLDVDPEIIRHYQHMSDRMAHGMDMYDRKRSHYETYLNKQSRGGVQTFELTPHVKGHIVFNADGHLVLLDTGSPVSFGREIKWQFMERLLRLKQNYLGVTSDYLSQMIGVPIEFLLGMDVLKDLSFHIDMRNGRIEFSNFPLPLGRLHLRLQTRMDVPYTSLLINNHLEKMFVDTSAKLSYLKVEAISSNEAVDTETDFYPLVGSFETKVYRLPIEINGENHSIRFGSLPAVLQKTIELAGMDGILGTELFTHYQVTFNMQQQLLTLE